MSVDWRLSFVTGREQFHYAFHQGIFSDVKLILDGGETIDSHSLVLKIRSPVFEKILEKVNPTSKGSREISIQGFGLSEIRKFIQFLYTDELEIGIAHELQKILSLAKKFKVHGLVSKCTSALISSLSVQNAASTFQTAKDLNELELEGKALQFILNNATEIVETSDFSSLNQLSLCEILEKDGLDIKEIDLFFGVLKWAQTECTKHKIQDTPKHKRLVLKEALNLIRFPTFSKQDFVENVVPTGILNERESTEVNRYLDAAPENRQFVTPVLFSCKPRTCMCKDTQLDLLNTDEENHKLLARFALKKKQDSNKILTKTNLQKSIHVSSAIVEICPKLSFQNNLEDLKNEIFEIKKYGLHWGAWSIGLDGKKLLLSFAADENRSYGVSSIIEEIQERLQEQVEFVLVKSFKEDILLHV